MSNFPRIWVAILAGVNVVLAVAAPSVSGGDSNHVIYAVIHGIGLVMAATLLGIVVAAWINRG